MTIMALFSVRDVVSNTYGTPFSSINEQTAIRSLKMEMNSGQSVLGSNPDDFELYAVGHFDQDTGQTELLTPLVLVCRLSSLADVIKPEA